MPPETKYEVQARDGYCIICEDTIEEYHHAYYGWEAIYTPNRNDPDQIVGLCNLCHDKLHSRGWNDYREFCKEYLRKMYPWV